MPNIAYPYTRLRRNRKSLWSRNLLAECCLSINDLILPIFVKEGHNVKEPIQSMPDIYRFSIDLVIEHVKRAYSLGIQAIILFPNIDNSLKSLDAKEALNKNSIIYRTIKAVKNAVPEIGIITDVALDPYTSHGHDGVLDKDGYVDNDKTIEILCQQALNIAEAGGDIVAPSDMMDGRIISIRKTLESSGFHNIQILAYSAKYNSNFYHPFREAVGSKQNSKISIDKSTYHMSYSNTKEAIDEAKLDISEGADMLMIKPGTPYLDIIKVISSEFNIPIIAYQVSGEYSMIKLAAKQGLLPDIPTFLETLVGFKRAGASAIVSYAALEIAQELQ